MNISKISIILILLLTLTAYSRDYKWVSLSAAAETDLPVIKAMVASTTLDQSTSNHVTLPLTIIFTADQPVTIYYTTNGEEPTTSTTSYSIVANANSEVIGPTINSYDNTLFAIGVDATGSLTTLLTYTFVPQ